MSSISVSAPILLTPMHRSDTGDSAHLGLSFAKTEHHFQQMLGKAEGQGKYKEEDFFNILISLMLRMACLTPKINLKNLTFCKDIYFSKYKADITTPRIAQFIFCSRSLLC